MWCLIEYSKPLRYVSKATFHTLALAVPFQSPWQEGGQSEADLHDGPKQA